MALWDCCLSREKKAVSDMGTASRCQKQVRVCTGFGRQNLQTFQGLLSRATSFFSLFFLLLSNIQHTHTHTHTELPLSNIHHTQSYPRQTYITHTELPLSNIHQTHILTSYLIHLPLSKSNPPTLLHYRLIVHTNLRFQVDGDVGTALSHFILCGHFVLSPILFCKVLQRT